MTGLHKSLIFNRLLVLCLMRKSLPTIYLLIGLLLLLAACQTKSPQAPKAEGFDPPISQTISCVAGPIASQLFFNPLIDNEIKISMDGKGRTLYNTFIERFWRTIKYEHLYLRACSDGRELQEGLSNYVGFYNQDREHQSLSYQTPASWYEKGGEKYNFTPERHQFGLTKNL